MAEIKASVVVWKRFRTVVLLALAGIAIGGAALYMSTGGRLWLDADGLLTRDHVTVAAPYEARITQILVRPGDRVQTGTRIAIVESPSLTRVMAELSIERAKAISRMAQLEGRNTIVKSLLPMAENNLQQVKTYVDQLQWMNKRGLTTGKVVHDVAAQYLQSAERVMTLTAEKASVLVEMRGNQAALEELQAAYKNLHLTYNKGELISPVDGYIGSDVGSVGQVLHDGAKIAKIHWGESFVLAYLPDGYLFNVEEGQVVGVKVRGQLVPARIERVLPVTEALPPEFQLPNRQRDRGQLVRIQLPENVRREFAVDQKVRVITCFTDGCRGGLTWLLEAAVSTLQTVVTKLQHSVPAEAAPLEDGHVG